MLIIHFIHISFVFLALLSYHFVTPPHITCVVHIHVLALNVSRPTYTHKQNMHTFLKFTKKVSTAPGLQVLETAPYSAKISQ